MVCTLVSGSSGLCWSPGHGPSIKFFRTHFYIWVKKDTMRVKCLAKEHNAVPRPGLQPRPIVPESSALSVRPPRLHNFLFVAPDNITAQALSPVQILVQWTAMWFDDLIGYKVMYRNTDGNSTVLNVTVDKSSGSSVTLDGLSSGSNYSVQVALLVEGFQGRPKDHLFVVTEG